MSSPVYRQSSQDLFILCQINSKATFIGSGVFILAPFSIFIFEGLSFLFFQRTPLVNPDRLTDSAEYSALSGDTDCIRDNALGFRHTLLHRPARLGNGE